MKFPNETALASVGWIVSGVTVSLVEPMKLGIVVQNDKDS
jgi:hypothetical protein